MASPATMGRRTKRKYALAVCAAALALGAVWLGARWGNIRAYARECLTRPVPAKTWCNLPAEGGRHALVGRRLLMAGGGWIRACDLEGNLLWQQPAPLDDPRIHTWGDWAAVYDSGGTYLILTDGARRKSVEIPSGIDWAVPGPEGRAAVITAGSGYLTSTLLLGPEGEEAGAVGLTDQAMAMAVFLQDGTLASCCVGTDGQWTLRLDGAAESRQIALDGGMVYDLRPWEGGAALRMDRGIAFFGPQGERKGMAALDGGAVLDWSLGSAAAALTRRDAGYGLTILAADGTAREGPALSRRPLEMATCGEFVCWIDTEALWVYDSSGGALRRWPQGGRGAELLPMAGGVVLLGGDTLCVYPLP